MAKDDKSSFDIRKIYVKDISLESPNAPGVFLEDSAQPEISVEATIKTTALEQTGYYEVVLGITVTTKMAEKVGFLVEVHQAGIFQIEGVPNEDLPLALEIACPNILLPFAREAISDIVGKAGFPQLLLSPLNFESIYLQKQQKIAEKQKSEGSSEH